MAHAFFLGVDAKSTDEDGSHDVTHTLIEKSRDGSSEEVQYRLDHIRRRTGVTSADDAAEHLQSLVAERPYIGRTSMIVSRGEDFGDALIAALRDLGMDPVAATITSGSGTASGETDEMGVQLGGVDLVHTLADLYRDEAFVVEDHSTELASQVARDMQGLAEALDEADGDDQIIGGDSDGPSFDADAKHITSTGLGAWLATERSFDPSQHLKEVPTTDGSSMGEGGL